MSFSEQATYQYAANNPAYYTDPLGAYAYGGGRTWKEQAMFLSNPSLASSVYGESGGGGMHRPGSGNHWADGWHYDDWVFGQGSKTYQTGLAAGGTDVGGFIYIFDKAGQHLWEKNDNGSYGYYTTTTTTRYFAGGTEYKKDYTETKWVSVDTKEGDPDIRSYVNPTSFNLSHVFGRQVSYVNYSEVFWKAVKLSQLIVYDQINLKFDKIALSVRTPYGMDEKKVSSVLALAFDQARFKLYDDFSRSTVANMMTDADAQRRFLEYLNERLQIFFPSPTTFAKEGYELLSVGEPPTSIITFIGPFFSN